MNLSHDRLMELAENAADTADRKGESVYTDLADVTQAIWMLVSAVYRLAAAVMFTAKE